MDDKRSNGRAFRAEFNVKRQILLDTWKGPRTARSGGMIHFNAAWTDPFDIQQALGYSLDALERRAKDTLLPYHSERLKWRVRDDDKFRARLLKNGPQAVKDFFTDKRPARAHLAISV